MKHIFPTLLCLLFTLAGSKAVAQQVVLHYPDGRQFKLNVSELDSISFHPNSWQDPTGEPNRVVMTLVADFEEGSPKNSRGQQRIHMGAEGSEKSMLWSANDQVWVGQEGSSSLPFTLASGTNSKHGEFIGVVSEGKRITSIYPYQESIRLSSYGEASGITLPRLQKAVAGSCDPRAALMMAVAKPEEEAETVALIFKNICSYIEITPTETLSQITITAHDTNDNPTYLAGTLTASYNNGEPSYTTQNGSNTISIDGPLEAGSTYYIAVLPGTMASGFHITCCKGAQSMTRGYDNSVNFNRSKYRNCSAFTTGGTYSEADYVDLGLTGTGIHRYWATRNLGAGTASDPGSYFAWGEVEGKKAWDNYSFNWINYKWGDKNDHDLSDIPYSPFVEKYNHADAKTLLESCDDAATQLWGDHWQMPTKADFQALITQCKREYCSNYKGSGVNGFIFYATSLATDPQADEQVDTDNSGTEITHIFLPFGGYINESAIPSTKASYYWSKEVDNSNEGKKYHYSRAFDLLLSKNESVATATLSANYRRGGQSIRAVYVGTSK